MTAILVCHAIEEKYHLIGGTSNSVFFVVSICDTGVVLGGEQWSDYEKVLHLGVSAVTCGSCDTNMTRTL